MYGLESQGERIVLNMLKDLVHQKRALPSVLDRLYALADAPECNATDSLCHQPPEKAARSLDCAVIHPTATLETPFSAVVAVLSCTVPSTPQIIGRGPDATIRLGDICVHRQHARVCWDEIRATHVIEDLGGRNGTFVDGIRVVSVRHLTDGCAITIGKTVLLYRGDASRRFVDGLMDV